MKKNQKGFGALEGILILVIVGLVGFVGWYIWDANNKSNEIIGTTSQPANSADSKMSKSTQTYTDPTGFTLKYPADWVFAAAGSKDASGEGEFGSNEFVSKANYQAGNNAYILSFETDTTNENAKQYATSRFANKVEGNEVISSTNSKTNGYDTQTVNYKLPMGGSPNGYEVFIVNNGKVVTFNYHGGESEKDYLPTYKSIISSIKFNN